MYKLPPNENSGTPHLVSPLLASNRIFLWFSDVFSRPVLKAKSTSAIVGLKVSQIAPFTPFLFCNVILHVPNRSPCCSKVNDLLAEMVVAVAFEHVISPVVERAPVSAGDVDGAFNFGLFAWFSGISIIVSYI